MNMFLSFSHDFLNISIHFPSFAWAALAWKKTTAARQPGSSGRSIQSCYDPEGTAAIIRKKKAELRLTGSPRKFAPRMFCLCLTQSGHFFAGTNGVFSTEMVIFCLGLIKDQFHGGFQSSECCIFFP